MKQQLPTVYFSFQSQNPLFLYALALFLGILFALKTVWVLIPLLILIAISSLKKRPVLLLLFLVSLPWLQHYYPMPPTSLDGEAQIKITHATFRKGIWRYRACLTHFTPNNGPTTTTRLPCYLTSKTPYLDHTHYSIRGTLWKSDRMTLSLKTKHPWQALKSSHLTLLPTRSSMKKWMKKYTRKSIANTHSAELLVGLATGELEDSVLSQNFGRLGLAHLLAISGFHFALITCLLHFILKRWLPAKLEAVTLMLLMTGYFLYIGNSPSTFRAWTMAMTILFSLVAEKRVHILNSLGFAMLVNLIVSPLDALSLSFQLSFLATCGIFLLYQPLSLFLQMWIPKSPLGALIKKPFPIQSTYLLLSMLRESLALTLAVHLLLTPLLLFHFNTLPLHSLIYNLFFPPLISISLLLLLIGLFCHPICPPLASLIHTANSFYTGEVLTLIEQAPFPLKNIYLPSLTPWLLTLLLTLLIMPAIGSYQKKKLQLT